MRLFSRLRKAITTFGRRLRGNRAVDIEPLPPGTYNVQVSKAKIDRRGRIRIEYDVLDTDRKIRETINPRSEP